MDRSPITKFEKRGYDLTDQALEILSTLHTSASRSVNFVSNISNDTVDAILKESIKLSSPVVLEIEQQDPGGRFGFNKVREMKELSEQAELIGKELDIDYPEINLLKIVLGTHDQGRFIEKIMNLDTLRQGVRHGVYSLMFLNENKLLDDLSDSDKYIILFSVYYHAEKDVPKSNDNSPEFENVAYKICYILRDLDKMHYFEELNFFEPSGVLAQIKDHYLNDAQRSLLASPRIKLDTLSLIDNLLKNKSDNDSDSVLSTEIKQIMNGPVNEQILECFKTYGSAPVQLIKHSWSSYLALRLTTLFDIKNESILKKILKDKNGYIKKSVNYIHSVDPQASNLISGSLQNYTIN